MQQYTIPYNSTVETVVWDVLASVFVPGGEHLIAFECQYSGNPHFRIYDRDRVQIEQTWDTLFGGPALLKDTRFLAPPEGTTLELQWCSPTGVFSEINFGSLTVAPSEPPNLVITPHRPPTCWERIMGDVLKG